MNSGQQLTLDIISKVDAGRISVKQAMQILSKSEATIFRKLARYRSEGHLLFNTETPIKNLKTRLQKNWRIRL